MNTGITLGGLNITPLNSSARLSPAREVIHVHVHVHVHRNLSALDILAIDELGRRLNIEVQTSIPAGMAQRLTYYVCVTYVDQLQEGQQYTELRPSISICVLAGAMFSEVPQLNHLQITEEMLYNATPIERWAWFLRNVENLSVEDVARLFPDPEFSEAAGVLQMIAQTPEELMEYRARLKYQRDEIARAQAAETAIQAAEAAARQAEAVARQAEAATREAEAATREAEAATREAEAAAREAEARGILRGQIVLLQRLLKQPVWTDSEFAACNIEQLQTLMDQLQQRVFTQPSAN